MAPEATAGVYLNARRVGTFGYRNGSTWFEYGDIAPGHPVLGQAFETDPLRRRTASGGVPAWFANLLPEPDSGLRELVARELGRKKVHDFLLLTYLGEDLPGAVRVIREGNGRDIPELEETANSSVHKHLLRFSRLHGQLSRLQAGRDRRPLAGHVGSVSPGRTRRRCGPGRAHGRSTHHGRWPGRHVGSGARRLSGAGFRCRAHRGAADYSPAA